MSTITIEEAQARLPDLIAKLQHGSGLVITRDTKPVAQLLPIPPATPQPEFGICRDKLTIVADDRDHLADFEEYMP
jgi:antitoxin (DNA-binding transcriptional repressor) of toxin-antitoxin stability system